MEPNLQILDTFLPNHETLFQQLQETVIWDERMVARQTASFGLPYNYSQISYPETPMHVSLVPVAELLETQLGVRFNNCLLNYYESGNNTMGFHSDDTSNLVHNTGVAIISLGSSRGITYRNKNDKLIEHTFTLVSGSMLYMDDTVQTEWLHAIKREPDAGPRISLTWRAFQE